MALRTWVVVAALVATGCMRSSLRADFEKVESTAIAGGEATSIGRELAPVLARHPGHSGFLVLDGNVEALLARVMLADRAERSIDLQYYIYHGDATGRLLAQRLLAAADRGVRVRVLLDDMTVGNDAGVAALDAHPNFEIRIFNPFLARAGAPLSRGRQFLRDPGRLTRRMHNKAFIVDGQVAVVGGRNIGDEYFGASEEFNFRDLDLAAIGPVVPAAASNFDRFWNSAQAFPVTAFDTVHAGEAELDAARAQLREDVRRFGQGEYARTARKLDFVRQVQDSDLVLHWGEAELHSDLPEKGDPAAAGDEVRMIPRLVPAFQAARARAVLISPYFVPGEAGTRLLLGLETRGVQVSLLTNSLAATDTVPVHSGYARYRKRLLAGGIEIHELQPAPGGGADSGLGSGAGGKDAESVTGSGSGSGAGASSGASLHAKSFVIDDDTVFVGSMNMDPRSDQLNTEMGVLVRSPGLAAAVLDYYRRGIAPERSYAVTLDPAGSNKLRWEAVVGGQVAVYRRDPEASFSRRMKVSMLRLLPIESQL